ncbi:hypothetical protein AAEP80_04065 [Curtobacterium sp. L3-7]|uniref:hypothetical protein n=1 Tax=Curtobacterium sp. L3-7 TaxID=3138787 RepID=UPI003B521D4B
MTAPTRDVRTGEHVGETLRPRQERFHLLFRDNFTSAKVHAQFRNQVAHRSQ